MQSPKVGDVFRGRYVLSGLIGRGGMGTVWRARDRSASREVALKFMASRLEGSALARKRFEREGKAAASLPSRHVVKVHDHGVEDGTPFLVMELLQGEDLASRLRRVGRLELPDAGRVILEVCRGLRRAHEIALIHRDLKPANIFLARDPDGREVAKILDFGMVKTTASTFEQSVATESGSIVGSVHYASPEQAQGERSLDLRSDLWSVAALAFRAVTGRLPFPGDALGVVVLGICSRPLPRATDVEPALPVALDAFFERAFQRDRELRFQSAIELADAFLAAVQGLEPVIAEPSAAPFTGVLTPSAHLGDFAHPGEPITTTSVDAATRVLELDGAVTRLLAVDEAAPTLEEESPFGAQSFDDDAAPTDLDVLAVVDDVRPVAEDVETETRVMALALRESAAPVGVPLAVTVARGAVLRGVLGAVFALVFLGAIPWLLLRAAPAPVASATAVASVGIARSPSSPRPVDPAPRAVPTSSPSLALASPSASSPPGGASGTARPLPRRCYDNRGRPTRCRPSTTPGP